MTKRDRYGEPVGSDDNVVVPVLKKPTRPRLASVETFMAGIANARKKLEQSKTQESKVPDPLDTPDALDAASNLDTLDADR